MKIQVAAKIGGMKMLDPKKVVDQMETEFKAGAASRDADFQALGLGAK